MKNIKTFDNHLKELKKDPEFANSYEEEKIRTGLALRVAEYRQKQNISQSELAKSSGITQQQLSKLERGENCNLSTFLKVCHSLGVEIELRKNAFA